MSSRPFRPPPLPSPACHIGDTDSGRRTDPHAQGGRNAGRWIAQWGPQRRSVLSTFDVEGTVDAGAGLELVTWDPKAQVYRDHATWYDAPGQWEFTGRFEKGTLIYRGAFELEGKHIALRVETRPQPGGGFTLSEYARVNEGAEERILRGEVRAR